MCIRDSGGILQGVNHGLSTGALFFLVGVIYEQRHTRLMSDFGGLWKAIPLFSVLSLIVVLSSMGLPGLNGFVGEFTILLGSMGAESLGTHPWIFTAFAASGVILAAVFLLWICLLYTFDAADERSRVDLGGRRIL